MLFHNRVESGKKLFTISVSSVLGEIFHKIRCHIVLNFEKLYKAPTPPIRETFPS